MEESHDSLRAGLAAGDAAAYRLVYERYGAALFAAALRLLANRADAEDAVQDLFASLVKRRERLKHVSDLKAYLFAALRHAAADIARRRRGATLSVTHFRPSGGAGDIEPDAEHLWRLVARLPHEQREVLVLKIQGDLTLAQIGEVFGISPNTAASRYRYALEKLQQMLEKRP